MPSKVTIAATSDLHGHLPEVPPCDVLLIGGDICPGREPLSQAKWLGGPFAEWLDKVPAEHVVATWGNHDWVGQKTPHLVPRLRWHLLVDQAVEVCGLKIYGSPHQPRFFDWAFNLDEPDLEKKWSLIPNDTDVLLLHGPPYMHGDLAPSYPPVRGKMEHVGSPSLLIRISQVRPRVVVCGHIHAAHGHYPVDDFQEWGSGVGTDIYNVAHVGEDYKPRFPPRLIELTVPREGRCAAG